MGSKLVSIIIGFSGWAIFSPLMGSEWLTNFENAKQHAETEKKDIYLVFTGSGWSKSCERLEAQVISQESFQEALTKSFVLLRIDLPLRSNLPKEVKAQKKKLAETFRVETYPSAFYLDASGRPYFREMGVLSLKVGEYAAHVLSQQKAKQTRDALLKQSNESEGMVRARLIVEALSSLPCDSVTTFYADQMSELERLDPEDTLKFTKSRKLDAALSTLNQDMNRLFNHQSFDLLIGKVDLFLKTSQPTGDALQQALAYKMNAYANSKRLKEAITVADEIIAVSEGSRFGKSAVRKKKELEKRL
ncbi:thioredoxin family protein [Akkermansiaceae bacterium]|nr:thioredoxin family protein [Akkermansiaceae bacterium]